MEEGILPTSGRKMRPVLGAAGGRSPPAIRGQETLSGLATCGLIPFAGASQQQSVSGWGRIFSGPMVKERISGPGTPLRHSPREGQESLTP